MLQPQIVFLLVMSFAVQCFGMLTLYSYYPHIMCYKSFQIPQGEKFLKLEWLREFTIWYKWAMGQFWFYELSW